MRALRTAVATALLIMLMAPPVHADTVVQSYGSTAEQTIDVTTPDDAQVPTNSTGRPWVMVLHGGSWAAGDKASASRAVSVFSDAGFVVFNAEYRKITDYPSKSGVAWADQRGDVLAALDWVHDNATSYGADPGRGAIYGVSAGGQLAASAGLYGTGIDRVRAIVSASGVLQPHRVVDVANSDPDVGHGGDKPTISNKNLAGWAAVAMRCPMITWTDCSARWADFKPETHISADDPPIFMTQGTADVTVPPQTARSFQYWMRRAGLEAELVECVGWGHTESCALDGGVRQAALVAWVKAKTT